MDELHLGRFTLLLATDPISDLPVAFALVTANDQDHMLRFLKNLRTWELRPRVVVTDGSDLYPAVLAELWPDADHQLCVFHVIKDINRIEYLDAVRRMRTAMSRRVGRSQEEAGTEKGPSPRAQRPPGMTVKEKAKFVFKHRYLIVKATGEPHQIRGATTSGRCGNIYPSCRSCSGSPNGSTGCLTLPRGSPSSARCRRAAIVQDWAFQSVPELAKAMEQLRDEKFPKLMAYLSNPANRRVRTNNHGADQSDVPVAGESAETTNGGGRRTLVRFVVLTLDAIWSAAWTPAKVTTAESPVPVRSGKEQNQAGQKSRQVA